MAKQWKNASKNEKSEEFLANKVIFEDRWREESQRYLRNTWTQFFHNKSCRASGKRTEEISFSGSAVFVCSFVSSPVYSFLWASVV